MQAPLQTLRLFPKLNTKKYIYYTSLIPFTHQHEAENPTRQRSSQFTVVFTPHFTPFRVIL